MNGAELMWWMPTENTSSEVWADSTYRSQKNEKWLASKMLGQPDPSPQTGWQTDAVEHRASQRGESTIRAAVEHVFAHQKNRFGLFIRTIGVARAEAKLILANIAYNLQLRAADLP
ncbi:transposase [Chelativorans sp. ZYF759]|uniref:transposase n=1 Tax=Chelativorans sp. ZYF759 TaxID=2692213 RepID=UPI00145C8F95|nr:transposase [Chelativorans sp. ZYF759]NMG41451.1 transposase [Chelativorans sp. ZYF759]